MDAASRRLLDAEDSYRSVFPLGTLRCWVSFVVVVVAASQLGGAFTFVGLPLITGYMFVGALVGPQVLALIHTEDLQPLGLVTQCALAFICFSAGAELYLPELRALFKQILGAIIVAAPLLPFLNALAYHHCRGSIAAVAASIMVARSPASAIAIVKELRAKGKFTSAVLGMTVLGDVYVLILFSITTSIARTTCDNERFSVFTVLVTLGVMLLSIAIGWVVGRFLMLLMYFKSYVQRYLILPLGLGIFVFSHWLAIYTSRKYQHFAITLESLLICIVAGYVCTNASAHRHRFMLVLGKLGPYVFLPFFTLTGASLNLSVLARSFGFAVVVALVRAACVFAGTSVGGYLSGVRPFAVKENTLMWMCCITQAGVSLGLASEMSVLFPGFGSSFQSALIAVILVNQLVGPVLFRVAARAVGDAGKGRYDGDTVDEDAAVPVCAIIGTSPSSMAVANRLLASRWAVTLVVSSEDEATAARDAAARFGRADRAAALAAEASGGETHGEAARATAMVRIRAGAKRVALLPAQALEAAATAAVARVVPLNPSLYHNGATLGGSAGDEEAGVKLDEHGHPMRKIEDRFTAVVQALDFSSIGDGGGGDAGGGGGGDGDDAANGGRSDTERLLGGAPPSLISPLARQLRSVVATLDAPRLRAFVIGLATDGDSLRAAVALQALSDAAPKGASLKTCRRLALLSSLSDCAEFEAVGCIGVHCDTAGLLVASQLASAPLSRPVALFPRAAGTEAELLRAVGAALRSGATNGCGSSGSAETHRQSQQQPPLQPPPPPPLPPRGFARMVSDVRSALVASESERNLGGDLSERLCSVSVASLHHENTPIPGPLLGAVSERSRAGALAEVALYDEYEGEEARRGR